MNLNHVLRMALLIAAIMAAMAAFGYAQPSPPKATSVTIGGKNISIQYCAPSMRGRKIFGGAGALQPDNTVWRAGANNATALHTDADLTIGNVAVPAGDYTLYVFLDPKGWKLIVSKQTGQWGINRDGNTSLDESKALGRIPMTNEPALGADRDVRDNACEHGRRQGHAATGMGEHDRVCKLHRAVESTRPSGFRDCSRYDVW
jgi:Protein of unknown function (DUF2911)